MNIYFKEDLFKELHKRRPRLKEEDYADIYRCLVDFLKEDTKNNSTPFYRIPKMGYLYMTAKKAAFGWHLKKPNGFERFIRIMQSYVKTGIYALNPVVKTEILQGYLSRFKMHEIEKIQNEVAKDNKS